MTTAASQPVPPPRPPKKKHWVLRIFVTLVVLLLIIALAVQIVLMTDLPRGIVVAQIEKQLALRLTVKSLHTTWMGHTDLHEVSISLPLAEKAFLQVPEMKVKNTSLFGLILGRAVEVQKIELDHPHLYVLQDKQGGWNLQEVAELVARAGGKKTGEESAQSSSTPMMPDVHLVDGVITVIDNQQRTLNLSPLSVDGYRDTAVSFKYDVQIPPQLSITGRLVPGGNWAHELAIKLAELGVWAKPWRGDFPDVVVDMTWRGALSESGIDGRLEFQNVAVNPKASEHASVSGAMGVGVAGGVVTLRPDNMIVNTATSALPHVKLASGALTFNPTTKDVKADQLLVSLFGGAAKVNAEYNLNTSAGRVDTRWEKLVLPKGMTQDGSLSAVIGKPFPDKVVLDAHLNSSNPNKDLGWLANLAFRLEGSSFSDFDWTLTADKIDAHRHDLALNLDGLKMAGGLHDNTLTLASIGLPNKDLVSGTARYKLTGDKAWEAHLVGQRWPMGKMPGTEMGFEAKVRGNDSQIAIDNILFKTPDASVSLNGKYVYKDPKPLDVELTITNAPPAQTPAALAANPKAKLVNGSIDSHIHLNGTVEDPFQLTLLGHVDGRELDIHGHHLGDISLVLSKQSHMDSNGVFVYTDSLSLLGGQWGIDSVLVFDTDLLKVNISLNDVQLNQVAQLADQQNITGTLGGKLTLLLPKVTPDPNLMQIDQSSFTIKNLNANGVMIDQIDAALSLNKGYLQIDPIHLKRDKGAGNMHVGVHVNDFRKIDVTANIEKWPVDIDGVPAHLDASVGLPKVLVTLPDAKSPDPKQHELRVEAPQINFHGTTTYQGAELADINAFAGVDGRVFDLRGIHMKLLGGRLDGQAHADLDKLLSTTAEFTWERLDLKKVALMLPALDDFSGKLTGNLRIAPTTVPRPLEPLALVLTTKLEDGHWRRAMNIKDARFAAYFGNDETMPQAGFRIVMDDSKADRSFIHLADGSLEIWGRTSLRGRRSSSMMQIMPHDLQLNQIVHALEPTAADMPGLVSGSLMLIRSPRPTTAPSHIALDQMFPGRPPVPVPPVAGPSPSDPPLKLLLEPIYGEGHIELTKTNLAKFGVFAALYNTARLFQNVNTPEGHGKIELHLERGSLRIDSMRYFNRGTEIRGVAMLPQVWKLPNNPINATASLTARPLGGIKLPFISDVDVAFTAIQQSLELTSVKVLGTLHNYKVVPLRLSEMGEEMKNLLVNDARHGGE